MRNKFNANWSEGNKKYNTNQNNTDESNLDNNRSNLHNKYSQEISEAEISEEFQKDIGNYKQALNGGQEYANNLREKKDNLYPRT